MTDPTPTPDPDLRAALKAAADDLVYTSESDRPFTWFFLPGGAEGWPYGADDFARRLGAEGERAEERDLDRFFQRHVETSDPYDTQAQAIRPRYERLRELLRTRLEGVRVFRIGNIEVRCYVVGHDGRGNLAGVETVAIET
jgi:Nuclease A inhibitor-like protein